MNKTDEARGKNFPRISERASTVKRVSNRDLLDIIAPLRSQGKDIVTLKGAPDWLPPEHVLEAAAKAAKDATPPPSKGFKEFRRAIANMLEREDGIVVDPETQILVTNGALHAVYIAFMTLLNPGDEVVTYSPFVFINGPYEMTGTVPVLAKTREENKWRWDAEALESSISSRTRMIFVSSPTNPTGYVATEEDLLTVTEIARKHNLFVVSDEAYDKMLYDGARHIRLVSLPGVKDQAITICSFTKSYAMGPWRVGFIVAPPDVTPYLRKILEWNLLACNHVAQRAAQAALEGPQDWVREIPQRFRRNRDLMVAGLKSAPGISFIIPKGTPFLFLNTRGLGLSGEEFSRKLICDYGVPTEPGTFFGSDSHVRLMFGGTEDDVREAAKRISEAARDQSI